MKENVTVIEEKHIPEKAFFGRADLVRVRLKNVWSVGPNAFSACPNLQEVLCEDGPAVICESAFSGCPSLSRILFSPSLKTIGESAFAKTSVRQLSFPDGVSLIGNNAFCQCRELETVSFPPSLKEIGASAFSDCSSLRMVDLGSVSVLHDGCFANTAVRSVRFPASVFYIGRDAFSNCGQLRMVVFENPDIQMRGTSFVRCENLMHAVYPHRSREEHRVLPHPLTQTDMTASLARFDRSVQDPVTALFRICFPFGLTGPVRERCLALVSGDPVACCRYVEQMRAFFSESQLVQIQSVLDPLLISIQGPN